MYFGSNLLPIVGIYKIIITDNAAEMIIDSIFLCFQEICTNSIILINITNSISIVSGLN